MVDSVTEEFGYEIGEKFAARLYPVAVCGWLGKQIGGGSVVFEEGDRFLTAGGAFSLPVEGPLAVIGESLNGPTGRWRVAEHNASEDKVMPSPSPKTVSSIPAMTSATQGPPDRAGPEQLHQRHSYLDCGFSFAL